MTHAKTTTMKRAYNSYKYAWNKYGYRYLYECYDRPSRAKSEAINYCYELEHKYNGYNGTIIGYNTCTFSYGFLFDKDGKTYFAYITRDYDRLICLDEV